MASTTIKNAVHGWYKSTVEYVMPVNEKSEFNEKGVLTPEEFVKAGCQLVYKCPTWSWEAGDSKKKVKYLPDNQQYLISRNLPCLKRVKSLITATSNNEQVVENGEWLNMENDDDDANTNQIAQEIQDIDLDKVGNNDNKKDKPKEEPKQPQININDNYADDKAKDNGNDNANEDDDEFVGINKDGEEEEIPDIELSDEEFDTGNVITYPKESQQEEQKPKEEEKKADGNMLKATEPKDSAILKTRTYDISITFDKYYRVPRVWLRGYDEHGEQLTSSQVFEDISADHAHKTVTVEGHPHTGVVCASIHPCRHSEVMKRFMTKFEESGKSITIDQYLFLFLKFMSAVIPTIQYDFTQSVDSK